MMNTENRTKCKTGRNIAKHAVAWFALPLLSTQLNAVAPIVSPPTTILQVDPGDTLDFQAGAVSTFVGQNTTGFQNGTGTAARFSSDAQGIAFDNAGNLYITDTSNHRIRKISPSGVVTTFVGSGTAGNVNDTGTAAQVSSPQDIDIDSGGILYVADSGNDAIRTIDASGLVNDLIDNGTGDATGRGWQARFDEPVSIAADRNNNLLYVMDKNNNRIKKIDLGASWLFSTSYCTNFVGDGNSGHIDATGTSARITYGGLALNKNGSILYLADTGNHCIRSINTSTGAVTTLAGGAGSSGDQAGIGTAARFNSPTDVAVDDDGYVYVADYGNNKIKRISPVTGLAMDLAGTSTSNSVDGTLFSAQFRSPLSLGYSDEVLYITQEAHGRVRDIVKPDHFLVEDIDSATVSVSLAVNDGTLSIDLSGGGSITAGSNGSASFTMQGTMDQLNQAFSTLEYDHDMGFTGVDTITYSATDGVNSTGDSTVDILVRTNDAPVIADPGPINIASTWSTHTETLSITDPDGDPVTISVTLNFGGVALTLTGNDLLIDPDFFWTGDASITITAEDPYGGSSSLTFFVSVGDPNDAPVLGVIGNQTTPEETTKAITLSSTDADGDTVTYSATIDSGSVTASLSGSNLNLTPSTDWTGTAVITVTADDGVGGTDTETFNLTVTNVNDVPVLDAIGDQTTNEDVTKNLTLSATDVDGDTLTYSATVNSGNVTANVTGTSLDLVPDADWAGTANITVTVDDGNGGTDSETFDLTVTAVNDAPVLAAIGDQTTPEDVTKSLTLAATDAEGDSVTFTATVNSGSVTATVTGTNLDLVPLANWFGTANITVTADDGNGATDSETFDLTVTPVQDPPTLAAIGDQTTTEDVTKTLTLAATDPDGDGLTFTATVNSGNVTANITGTTLDLVPDPDWFGTANITVTVDDGNGNTDAETFDLTVTSVNDAPVLAAIGDQTTNEDVTKSLTLAATDAEGDTLTFTATVNSGNVTANVTGTNLDLVPDPDWSGTASITVTVDDGNGGTDSETFNLTVNAVQDPPVLAAIGDQTTAEDVTKTLTLAATDADGDSITFTATVNSGDVTATVSGTTLNLVPDPDWNGTASITVTADDGNGNTDSETFNLTVTAVNDDPVLAAIGNQTTDEDVTKTLTLAATDVDGDTLTFSAVVNSGDVTANVTGTTLDLVPDPDWNGTASITVTVNDGNGGTDSETFNLTVNGVNDAPELDAIGNQTTDEDVTKTLALSASDTESDPLTYTAVVNSGDVTANVTGTTLDLVPDPDWNGVASITVTVDDGLGGTDSETFTLTVNAVNDDPVLAAIGDQTTTEDVTKTLTLSATDVEGDTLTYTAVVNSGDVTANLTGTTLDLVPDADWNGTANITVTVDDGNGGTDSETFNLTVTAVNDDPVLDAIGDQTTDEDVTKTLTLSATDPEGDTLTYTATVNSGNVTATVTGTTLDLVPDPDWNGTAEIEVTVDDGNGGTDSETFDLTVNPVQDPPVLAAIGDQTTTEDVTKTLTLAATDADGDTLTFSAVVNSGNVTANLTGTTLDLAPDADWNGTANITVTVDDGNGNTDSETFNLTVTAVNDAPVLAAIGDQTTDEDVTKSLTLSATDADGDTLTYTAVVNSGNITATVTGTNIDLIPDADWNGTANITVTVNDGNGGTDSETFNLTVNPINDAPVLAAIGNQTTTEDVTKTLTLSATDVEGDTLSFTAVVNSGDVTATLTGTTLDLIPDADWTGTASITVTVNDGNGGTDSETFNLTVTPVNDDPVLDPIGNQTTNEDVTKTLALSATDPDGDTLTFTAVVNSGDVTATVTGTTLDLIPDPDWHGTASITVTVDDGNGSTDSETFNLTVNSVNDAPVLDAIGDQTTDEDVTKTLTLSATDVDGDTLTFTAVVNSGDVTATVTGTTLDLVPDPDWNGTANITVTVDDGNGGTDSETFDLTVDPVNDAPVLAAIGDQTTDEDVTKTLTLSAIDTEGDTLTFTAVVNSGNVTATVTGTTLDLIPDPNWNGVANITVTVDDGNGGTDSETFNLTVNGVNDAPVLDAIGDQTTDEDVTKTLTLSATDTEGDPLTYTAVVNSGDVTATVTGTTLDLIPDPDWNGVASITVTVDDGLGGTDSETFNLTVNPINDAPVLAAIGDQTTAEDVTKTLTLSATDVEGDTLTYSAVVNSGNVTANLTGTTLDLVPDADWNGVANITVTVDDGNGGTDSETFNLTVTAVNDAPVLDAIGDQTTPEDVTKTLTLSATDEDGDTLTFTAVVNSGNVTATVTGTTLDLIPDPDWNGTANITVTVDDGNGGTDSETFDLTVTPVQDPPVLAAIGNQTTPEDVTKTLTLSATDADGDTLTYSAVVNSGNVTANLTGTTLDLVPDADWTGVASITVTVNDGNGNTDSETFNLTVTDVNDPPVLAAIGDQTTNEDVTKTLTLSATDADGDTLTYTATVNSGNVTATVTGTTLNLVPDPDWNGVSSITVTVDDGNGGTDSETFNLTVNAVNDDPVLAAIGNQTTDEDVTKTLTLSASDVDGDTLTFTAVVNSGNVTANLTGTTLDLVPDADWNGTANITVTVNDGNGSTNTETFDLVVNPVNDAPTALNLDNDTIQEGKPIASLVGQFSTTDVDTGDTFTYSLVAGSGDTGNGSFSISGNQLLSAAVFNYIAQSSYSIRVNVTDSGGGMYEKIFTITIEQGGALTINSYPPAGGSTSGAGDYTPGDTATATATPASGYIFAGWTGDIPSGANAGDTPLSVLMDANKTLNAYFTRAFHTVDVSVFPERHGYAHGGGVILNGTSITLTAEELTGGDNVPFSHWRINGTDTANTATTLTLTVDQEYQIEAVFDMGLSDNFVLVPAQTYMREKNTRYEHNASVSAFYISKYEITKDEWYNVYNWAIVNGYSFEFDPINYNGYNIPHNDPSYPGDYSIIGVYWNDMVKWCNARSEKEGFTPSYYTDAGHSTVHRSNFFASTAESLTNDDVSWRNRGYRLPTEAEWEAAARGGYQNLAYPSGHTIDSNQAFYDQDLDDLPITSATLHSRIPNGYGIYDMAGNGWEACWDWMSKYWYDNPGSATLDTAGPTLAETNLKNNFRAIRGGSGHSNHKWTRVNARYFPTVWDRFPITIRPVFPAPSTPDATLRVVTQQGSSGSVTGGGIYEIGSSATLQAIPEGTATFVEWQDADQNTLGTANTLIYTASADATIYAIFTETTLPGADLYTVTTQTNPHGSGTLSGQGTYVSGHTVEFTATAADGYLFSGFYGDALGTSSPLNITVDQNMTVWGAFENDKMSMDSDTDGLTDYYELAIGSDPFTRDTDGDQIADGIEVDSYGSDPLSFDTDGDGHEDGVEFHFSTNLTNENNYPFFPKDELIRHFPFAGGIALDAGPLTVHGVASNVISAIDRHSDASSAFTFNGLTSQVTVGGYNGATGSTARTLTGWIKVLLGNGPIVDYGTAPNAFSVSITPAGALQVEADAATITGSTNLKDGNWHQFVVSFPEGGSASDISVYIDGAAETTTSSGDTASVLATLSSSPVTIGKSTIGQFFVGDLDEIRLYERVLPAWEVTQLYNLESVVQPPETPITITSQPVTTTVAYMDPATLTVSITGGVSPIFQWEAQYGKAWHYIPGANSANLTFPNAIDYDGRSYRCGIIDQHGNVTYTSVVRLYVLHPPTLPEPEPDWQFVTNVGGKIVANTEGTKRIEWEWFKDGVSLGTTNKNMYLIPNTANQAVHGGDYHYIATNSIGSVTSNTFTVSIIDPTEITQHPESTGILQGSSGTLTVVAAGGGTLDYQWLKYNPATRKNDEVEGATSPTLTISAMDASKEGQYSCQVSNGPSVRISKRANVTMWVAPVFTTQPLNISVNEYTPAQLDSLATGDPAPTYQWQKFTAGSWVDVPRYINNTFLLKKALSSHAGTYRVVATNDGGSAISNSAIITVYYKPVITVDIDHITANEDTDVTFNVVANALDATGTSIGYQWYYNNAPLSDGPGITGSNTATLVLTNVNRANNYGVYYCQLSNAVGVSKTRARRLNIVDKPISYVPLTDKTLIAGGKLYLAVSVKGAKPLTMQWYKDGTAIPGAIYSKYIITSVTTGDSGLYTLIATNPAGSVQEDANVTVAAASVGAPPPPIVADASNPIEDADLDGVSNLLEEAFGSDPLDPKSTSKPEIEIVDDGTGDLYTSIRYNHSKSAIGIDLVLEGSTDLQNWAPVDLSDATVSQLDRETHVEVTIYLPVTTDQMYFRMQVSN